MTGLASAISKTVDLFDALPAPIKTDIGVIVGILAVAGPLGLAVSGIGKLIGGLGTAFAGVGTAAGPAAAEVAPALESIGTAGTAAAVDVEQINTALAAIPVAAREAALAADASLASIGAAGETAGSGIGAGGLLGMGRLGSAGLLAGGGLVAGQLAGQYIPGEAGQATSGALEGAGIGAGIGMFFPEFGGSLTGAAIGGLVGAISTLTSSGPSFVQQMTAMGDSIHAFDDQATQAAHTIVQLHAQIANDRVARDQAQQSIQAAQIEERATRGTPEHAGVVDQLRRLRGQLQGPARPDLHGHYPAHTASETAPGGSPGSRAKNR